MTKPLDPITKFEKGHQKYNQISRARCLQQSRVLRNVEARVGDILQLQSGDLREWAEELSASGLTPSTVRFKIQLVRPFFTWAWENGLIPADQLLALRSVKPPRGFNSRGDPRPYTRKEMVQFWIDLDAAFPGSKPVARKTGDEAGEYRLRRYQRGTSRFRYPKPYVRRVQMYAIASLAVYGGLRRMEIYHLTPEDVNPENEYIVVRGAAKNREAKSRNRAVPWLPQSRDALAHWLDVRRRLGVEHNQLWITAWSEKYMDYPMSERPFGLIMTKLGYEFHRLRHTYATEALRSGMPLQVLSRILGHARLEQTMGYAELVRTDLVEASALIEDKLGRALGG